MDGTTQYIALPYFGEDEPIRQPYASLLPRRMREWDILRDAAATYNTPFVPTPAVGWNAIPRGELPHFGEKLDDLAGQHPYTPIVTGNTPELFGDMVEAAIHFTRRHVPPGEQIIPIFAWNEYGEGGSLLQLSEGGRAPSDDARYNPKVGHPYLEELEVRTHQAAICASPLCSVCQLERELYRALNLETDN